MMYQIPRVIPVQERPTRFPVYGGKLIADEECHVSRDKIHDIIVISVDPRIGPSGVGGLVYGCCQCGYVCEWEPGYGRWVALTPYVIEEEEF